MPVLTFKYGKNLTNKTPFIAGTFFLDIETGELFYDDPTSENLEHQKIIDTDTLLYWVEETIMSDGTTIPGTELPPIGDGSGGSGGDNASSNTSAILG
jgi:hypothetical protein